MPRHGLRPRAPSLGLLRPGLGILALVIVLGAIGGHVLLRAAAPSVRWRINATRDTLRIWLRPGASPLAGYVMRETSFGAFGATEPATAPLTLDLRPGEIVSTRVTVTGPDPEKSRILAVAPVPPRIAGEEETAGSLVLRSSEPLIAVRGLPAGSWQPAEPGVVTLTRGVAARSYRIVAIGAWGGRSVWSITVPALPEVPVVWFGSSRNGQVYLTIDDGWYPSAYLLQLMRRRHVPVTAFLIARAAEENPGYWRDFVAAGGVIEDHTVDHQDLAQLSFADAAAEWRGPIADYPAWFGVPAPTMGRPPYGRVSAAVRAAAAAAGLKELVMWSAEWLPGKGIETWNGGPLQPGDIILLHWVPGVGHELAHLLKTLGKDGLHPAPLSLSAG